MDTEPVIICDMKLIKPIMYGNGEAGATLIKKQPIPTDIRHEEAFYPIKYNW